MCGGASFSLQRGLKSPLLVCAANFFALARAAPAADFTLYADVKPILNALAPQLSDQARWDTWSREHDQAIRARLAQGDLDTMVNLLLFGISYFNRELQIPRSSSDHAA
jgi:hypothetical protein